MTRTTRASVRSFGGGQAYSSRITVGSLVPATADVEVQHFVRRRRSSAVGLTSV